MNFRMAIIISILLILYFFNNFYEVVQGEEYIEVQGKISIGVNYTLNNSSIDNEVDTENEMNVSQPLTEYEKIQSEMKRKNENPDKDNGPFGKDGIENCGLVLIMSLGPLLILYCFIEWKHQKCNIQRILNDGA